MSETPWLAETFHANRPRLWAMAYRMLGSSAEADDAVQEAWLRLCNGKNEHLANPAAWLTTVTARICLDYLRQRARRGEEPLSAEILEVPDPTTPNEQLELAQSVSLALLIVLDPTVAFDADDAARRKGAADDAIGVEAVFRAVAGRSGAEVALLDGKVGAVVIRERRLFLAMRFTARAGRIMAIGVIADPQRLQQMRVHRFGVNKP